MRHPTHFCHRPAALIAASLLLAGGVTARAAAKFVSAAGRFGVVLPGTPAEETLVARTGAGPLTTHLFVSQGEPVTYVVSYCDLPASTETMDASKVLDQARDGAVASRNGKLMSPERRVALNFCPGRDLQISVPGGRVVRTRIYLAKRRLYQVVAVIPGSRTANGDVDSFFDSFEMTSM